MPSASSPDIDDISEDVKGIIQKVVDDVGKSSAIRQLIIGAGSGWLTGFTLIKVGRATAAAIGSGILLLELANHNGYININWDKVNRKAEKLAEKIDESATTSKPSLIKKVGKFVDRKLDKAESVLKKKEHKAKKWFQKFDDDYFVFEEIHVFFFTYLAGIAAGMVMGIICR